MLGDGVVGSLGWVHGQYRSDGLARQERPCCRVETVRHGLAVYVESSQREREEGREGEGEWSHRSGRMMGEQSGMPRHPSQKTGERERLLPPVAAAAAPACVLLLGEAAAWRFSFRVSCASELRLEAAQARRQCRSAATATISESAVESHSVRPMS